MADPDAQLKDSVIRFCQEQGIPAEAIPRGAGPTPDLLIDADTTGAAIMEIKHKTDDARELEQLSAQLSTGRVVEYAKPIDYWNRMDGLVGDAVAQMQAYDPTRRLYHVIWAHCTGLNEGLSPIRLHATLYGTQKLVSTDVAHVITAYYFLHNSFFRHRETLDAVIISQEGGARLQLNPFSVCRDMFARTRFGRVFGDPFLPEQQSGSPNVMICDADAPRGDKDAMVGYLREKYRLNHLQLMPMSFIAGMVGDPT